MATAIVTGSDAETYAEVSPLIYSLSRKFARQFKRADLDEVISQAHFIYQQAYMEYDYRHEVQFTYFAQYKIWKGLLEHWRTDARRESYLPRTEMPAHVCSLRPSTFDLEDFIARLTLDAGTVVRITLDNKHNGYFIRYETDGKMTPRSGRKAVRGILKDQGWQADRINKAFAEIRKALS